MMDEDREMRSPKRDRRQDRDRNEQNGKHRERDRSGFDSEPEVDDRKERRHRQRRHSSASGVSDESEEDDRRRHRKSHRHRSRSRSRDREDRYRRKDRKHRHRSRSGERASRHRRRSRSPPPKKRRLSRDDEPSDLRNSEPHKRSHAPLPSQNDSFKGTVAPTDGSDSAPDKQKPNFKPTGLLAKEANTVAGTSTVLKYHEPPEARKPPAKEAWRMYVFKGKDLVDTIYLHQRSAWLVGRDQKVTDYLLEHPSISKQHAVIQFRHITSTNEYGDKTSKVKPYLIDLESANGTKMNGKAVEASRFVELVDGDVVAFGESEREYVMMLPQP